MLIIHFNNLNNSIIYFLKVSWFLSIISKPYLTNSELSFQAEFNPYTSTSQGNAFDNFMVTFDYRYNQLI